MDSLSRSVNIHHIYLFTLLHCIYVLICFMQSCHRKLQADHKSQWQTNSIKEFTNVQQKKFFSHRDAILEVLQILQNKGASLPSSGEGGKVQDGSH